MDQGRLAGRLVATAVAILAAPAAFADLPEIEKRGKLRALVVLETDGRTMESRRADSPGFDYELLESFAKLRRLAVEIVPVGGWDKLVPELLAGRGDLIAGSFTVTDARREAIDFTTEVMPTRSVVVTRRPHPVVATIGDLRAQRVTVFKGTSMVDLLLGLGVPAANLDYDVPAEGLSAGLRSGRVSCVVHDVQTAVVDQRADPQLQIGMFVGPPRSYAWGVAKGDARLRAALDEHIDLVKRSGTWSRLIVKYFGEMALPILQKARGN